MKKILALVSVAVLAGLAQPALADGYGNHHWGRGYGWLPFAAGAVVGGVVVGSMMQQAQPVYAQPVYVGPPPPRIIVQRAYYAPAPIYQMPAPPPGYYYERE